MTASTTEYIAPVLPTARSNRVIIVGGGVAGIAATVALQSAGVKVTLLEARKSLGGRASARLIAGFPAVTATPTDLLERPLADAGPLPVADDGMVELSFRPFEIRPFRLKRAATTIPSDEGR